MNRLNTGSAHGESIPLSKELLARPVESTPCSGATVLCAGASLSGFSNRAVENGSCIQISSTPRRASEREVRRMKADQSAKVQTRRVCQLSDSSQVSAFPSIRNGPIFRVSDFVVPSFRLHGGRTCIERRHLNDECASFLLQEILRPGISTGEARRPQRQVMVVS